MSAQPQIAKPVPRLVAARPETAAPSPQSAPNAKSGTETIGTFVGLEIEARRCADLESLRFVVVNATRKLAGFDDALLVERGATGALHVTSASGVHKIDRHAPLIQLIDAWVRKQASDSAFDEPKLYDIAADAQRLGIPVQTLPVPHAYWLPFKSRSGALLGGLIMFKQQPWRPQTVSLLIPLAGAYAHAWEALVPTRGSATSRLARVVSKRRLLWASVIAAALAGIVPVPMSSLAPAEIVAADPGLVTSPIDGVIADIAVSAGTMVAKGTPLLTFSDVDLRNDRELAKSRHAVAQARYFKAVQTATATQKDVEEVAIAKAELAVAANEVAYSQELLGRTVVKAERSGIVIYSSKSDWIGRPVKTGERIMEIGNPDETELKIELPVSDALSLDEGADVALFLDGDPLTAVRARVTRANYRPSVNGEQQLVYKVQAAFADGEPRRIGLRGVARVSSGNVPLAFYLFRRPIAALRQRFGI